MIDNARRTGGAAEVSAHRQRRLVQLAVGVLTAGLLAAIAAWVERDDLQVGWRFVSVTRPFTQAYIRPLTAEQERRLKPGDSFRECATEKDRNYCPEVIVVPAGSFTMGSPPTEKGRFDNESQHAVAIAKPFAVSKFALTFEEWDTCVEYGDCPSGVSDSGWGRFHRPVVNVTWDDARHYAAWLSRMTGKPYRLLSEAEYEYAARAGTQTAYPWGDDIKLNGTAVANCAGCGGQWEGLQTAPVGSFAPNRFGLFDIVGNAWEWVEDCYHPSSDDAPQDGSAWADECPDNRMHVVRGGSWYIAPVGLRSAVRFRFPSGNRSNDLGFRLGRTLTP